MQNYVTDNKNVNFPGVIGSNTMPYLSFNGQNAITSWGNNNNSLIQNYVDNIGWNLFNNWMWTKGRHSVNFGGEFHYYYEHALTDYSSGHFSFSQAETSVPNPSDPNFATDGILTYNNAGPLQITQSGESLMNGVNRPNINPLASLWSGNWNTVKPYFEGRGQLAPIFSTSAFTKTANQFVLGNSRRAYQSLRGPLYPVENLSVKKIFRLTEGTSFSVRMDYFNAFNRTQLPYPGTNINASNFGLINSKFSATNRQGQISAIVRF